MKPIGKALLELRATLFTTSIFNALIDSMVVFLVSMLLLVLVKIDWTWSLVPWGIFFIYTARKKLKSSGYRNVEKRVPQLNEALRTAADSINQDNEMVNALHKDVLKKMKYVQTSAFIGLGRFSRQLITIRRIRICI
jgi:hypothetical protein